jgi:CHAT domain-containing protein/Tfp pilus assembly protein PilF
MNHTRKPLAISSCPSRLPSHSKTHTSLLRSLPAGLVILLLLLLPSPIAAQDARWSELIKQARALRSQGKYAEAIPVAEKAVQEAEHTFGADDKKLALSLSFLGIMLDDQGKYSEAEPLYTRALAILEKTLGPDNPDVAGNLNLLATLYSRQGRYAEAEPLYQRTLAIREKALGPDDHLVANSLTSLAYLYELEGKYAEAEPLYQRSLAIYEKTLGSDNPKVATTLNNLAALYKDQGKYAEAETLLKRAQAINEKALGPEDSDLALVLNNLADLDHLEGKYADAEGLYQRSLAILEKVLGPEHPNVANTLSNLALLYNDLGRYAEAEPLFKRSLAIREKALGPDHPDVATTLNNLALLYSNQGRYSEAEPLFKRSLSIQEKTFGPEHPNVALALNNLAGIYKVQGKYADVEPLYERSLAIRERTLGPNHPDVAISLNSLAIFFDNQGKLAEAQPLYERSLAIREKALGPNHPSVAESLNNLAWLYQEQGKYAQAEPLYQRSLAIRKNALGPDHPSLSANLTNLAALYDAQGQYVQAETYFELGLQNLSKQFESSFAYMSENDRLQFLETVHFTFDMYLSFCATQTRENPSFASRMFNLLLWEKGIVGSSVAALRAEVAAGGDAEALKIFDDLAAKKSESARLAGTRPKGWEQLRKSVDEQANDLEQQLARRVNALSEQKISARVSWRDIQKQLLSGEALVEFARYKFFDGKQWTDKFKYLAIVVTAQSESAPTLISIGDANDLEADPLRDYRLRLGLQANGSARGVSVKAHDDESGPAPKVSFYDAFWKPLEPSLKGIHRIYVSPDGILNQVVLGAVTADDGRLLMEKYDLRVVSSTKDILRGPRKATSDTAVLVGNPAFDLDETQQRTALRSLHAAPAEHPAPEAVEVATLRSRDLKSATLNPLPGTQVEVEAVSSLLEKKHWQVQTYTQQRALKESVLEVKGPRVLHLATHGFFEPDQKSKNEHPESNQPSGLEDPMLRSGLFFAGANRHLTGHATPSDLDDGVLTAYEATQLNLQGTELVVLSACETGLGEVAAGEGVFGLRRALQVAGAESVLMSMWAVPDRETQELMTLFYTKWLAGKDKHEALREAQLEMRDRVKARYGKDLPQYWGAFVLVGR